MYFIVADGSSPESLQYSSNSPNFTSFSTEPSPPIGNTEFPVDFNTEMFSEMFGDIKFMTQFTEQPIGSDPNPVPENFALSKQYFRKLEDILRRRYTILELFNIALDFQNEPGCTIQSQSGCR